MVTIPVDDEGVVISNVSLHVFHTLLQLHIVVVPRHSAGSQADDSAGEPGTVALKGKSGLGFDDKPWGSTFPINQHLLHPVFLHLELPQG